MQLGLPPLDGVLDGLLIDFLLFKANVYGVAGRHHVVQVHDLECNIWNINY